MSKRLAIIGAGGHGKVVGEIASLNLYKNIHFFDDKEKEIEKFPFKIFGNIDYLKKNIQVYDDFFVGIGENQIRFDIMEWLVKKNQNLINLVHPNATISKFISLGVGTCIMANAVVNPGTIIKNGVIINTAASVDHDCIIDDYAQISPNCALSGGVKVGKFSLLGTGTSVHPGINIGKNVKTGVGSNVYKNILDDTIQKN